MTLPLLASTMKAPQPNTRCAMEHSPGRKGGRILRLLALLVWVVVAGAGLSANPPFGRVAAHAADGRTAPAGQAPCENRVLAPPCENRGLPQPGRAPLRSGAAATPLPQQGTTASNALPRAGGSANDCAPIPGNTYQAQPVNPPPSDRPAEAHPDLNLGLRGYGITAARLRLVDYQGSTDTMAPQLSGLFADGRAPEFAAAYKVYGWDWGCNCPGQVLTRPAVTLLEMAVVTDEPLHVPDSGYTIGGGYEVLVLYASAERITLKYTLDDNVEGGYTLHLEGVCIDPDLLALYQSCDAAGRAQLPALRPRQAFARARSSQVGVAIRDNGTFLDPRSRKDWWHGR